MNTHLRALIAELKTQGWEYQPVQTNGSNHFVHPEFGKVAVASTPADWEDECQYTRQRVRKAMRRREVTPASPEQNSDPFQALFARIQELEEELRLVQEEAPRFWGDVQTLALDWRHRLVAERQRILDRLGPEICKPQWKHPQRLFLEEICLLVADSTKALYGVDLEAKNPFLHTLHKERERIPEDEDVENDFQDYDADAWEQWFDQYDNTTWKPDTPKKAQRKTHQKSTPNSQQIQQVGKKIYLQLAKELHPDKTQLESERIHRTHLMQQINAAYAKHDLRTLLSLLHIHNKEKAEFDDSTLEILQTSLQQQIQDLQKRLQKEYSELPQIGQDWKILLQDPRKQELLLRNERRAAENELRQIAGIHQQMANPQQLQELLRRTDRKDWADALFAN